MNAFLPGLCSITFRKLEPEAVVRLAAETSLAGIEWGGDIHVPPGDVRTATRVGRITREAGLAVSSYGSYLAPPDASPAEVEATLDAAEALGAPHLRIWPGSRNRPSAGYSAPERREAVRAIERIGEAAARRNLTVGLEYHPDSLTDDLASATDLVAEVRSPNVFLYWQPAPGLALDAALAEIGAIGREICHLHVFAWDRERNRYPLEAKAGDWRRCLAAVPERRWLKPSFAMLEFVGDDDPETFRRDAATLRALLDEVARL